jgi:hypothetical protein
MAYSANGAPGDEGGLLGDGRHGKWLLAYDGVDKSFFAASNDFSYSEWTVWK